jgi:hypothetical protein
MASAYGGEMTDPTQNHTNVNMRNERNKITETTITDNDETNEQMNAPATSRRDNASSLIASQLSCNGFNSGNECSVKYRRKRHDARVVSADSAVGVVMMMLRAAFGVEVSTL